MEIPFATLFIFITGLNLLGQAGALPQFFEDQCRDLHTSSATKQLTIKRGDPLLLNCSLQQQEISPKNIYWIKNGHPFISKNILGRNIVYDNGSLHIPATKSRGNGDETSDDGTYFCVVNYSSKSVLSAPSKVTVAVLGRISASEESISLKLGTIQRLNCSLDKVSPRPVITWFRDDVPIANGSIYNIYGQSSRLSLLPGNIASAQHSNLSVAILPSGALEIGPVTTNESGLYWCTATNSVRSRKSSPIQVTVLRNQSVVAGTKSEITIKPVNTSTLFGSTTHLECFATGHPLPAVSWSRNGQPIDFRLEERLFLVGQGTLVLVQTNTKDSGRYTCTASNGQSHPPTASAYLTVLVPPSMEVQPSCLHYVTVGQDSHLNCNVTGLPLPAITWYKEGKLLSPSANLKINNGEIVIRSVSKSDSGVYQCFGTNTEGSVAASQKLFVFDKFEDDSSSFEKTFISDHLFNPRQSTLHIKLLKLTSSSASISWSRLPRVGSYQVKIVDTTTETKTIEEPTQPKLVIKNLEPGHELQVSIRASRLPGDASTTHQISFVVPESHPSPGVVENFALVSPSSTEVLASWGKPAIDQIPRSYKVHVHNMQLSPESYLEKNFTQTSNVITGLRKYTKYGVKVAAVSVYGEVGPFTPLTTIRTRSDAPEEPPLNISVSIEGIDSALVKWIPPHSSSVNGIIKGYKLRYKQRSQVTTKSTSANVNQFLLKGLRKNAAYTVKIQVINDYGSGPFSKKVSFSTPRRWREESQAPGKPKTLSVQRFVNSLNVSWGKPDGNTLVREYIIGWGRSVPTDKTVAISSREKYYKITDLEPSTRYFLSVQAGNQAGRGEKALAKARTKAIEEIVEELYPPLGVHATVLTATTLNVSWHDTVKEKDSRQYVVRYKTNVPMEPRVQVVNSSDLNCIIHGLRPHTHYDIAVRVLKGNRKSAWSMTEKTVTLESIPGSAPLDLTVMPVGEDSTSVQLNWQPPEEPNGVLTGYLIFYTTDPNHPIGEWVIETVIGDKLSKELTDLTRNTHYYFKALARNSVGGGPYSEMVEYRTGSSQKPETPDTWSMPTWTWYTIIGGVTFLVLCIVAIATVVICRNKNTSRPSKPIEKGPVINGTSRHGSESSKYPRSSMSEASWQNARLIHNDDHPEYIDSRSTKSPYPFHEQRRYISDPSEMIPLNSQLLTHPDAHNFAASYGYPPYQPYTMNSSVGSPGNCTMERQSHFSDVGRVSIAEDRVLQHPSIYPRSTHTSDSRYSPDPSVHGSQGRVAADSAYGSEPTEDSPRTTIQHNKSYAKGQPKYLLNDKQTSHERFTTNVVESSRDSRSDSSTSMDELQAAGLANAVDFVETMRAQDDLLQ